MGAWGGHVCTLRGLWLLRDTWSQTIQQVTCGDRGGAGAANSASDGREASGEDSQLEAEEGEMGDWL